MNYRLADYERISMLKEKLEAIEGRLSVILAGEEAKEELARLTQEVEEDYGLSLSFLKEV